MLTAQRNNLVRLQERVTGAGKVDAERGIIYGVKILGKHSKNGREYSLAAMRKAVGLYEGAPVFVNHTDRRDAKRERGLEESFGDIRNVRLEGGSVFGDLHFLKTHPMAAQVCERAERFPNKIGLSHDAEGRLSRKSGKTVVEDIEQVRSVDLVVFPATNDSLFESVQNEAGNTFTKTQTPGVAQLRMETYATVEKLIDDDQIPIDQKVKLFRDALYAFESGKKALEDTLNAGGGPSGSRRTMAESYSQATRGGFAATLRESSRNSYQSTSKPNSTRRSTGGESYDELTRGGFLAAVRR